MPFPWEEKILIRQELWQAYYPNHSVREQRTVHFSGVSSSLKDYHAPFWTLLSLCNAQTENKIKAVVENEIQVVYKADLLDSLFSDGRTVYKGLLSCLFSSLGRVLPWNWCTVGSQAVPSLTPLFFFFSEEASDASSAFWFPGQTPNSVPSFQHKFFPHSWRQIQAV